MRVRCGEPGARTVTCGACRQRDNQVDLSPEAKAGEAVEVGTRKIKAMGARRGRFQNLVLNRATVLHCGPAFL